MVHPGSKVIADAAFTSAPADTSGAHEHARAEYDWPTTLQIARILHQALEELCKESSDTRLWTAAAHAYVLANDLPHMTAPPALIEALHAADEALAQVTAFEEDARYIMGNTNFAIVKARRGQVQAAIADANSQDGATRLHPRIVAGPAPGMNPNHPFPQGEE